MGFYFVYGIVDEKDGFKMIQWVYELGVMFFDMVEFYGWGENEKFFGQVVSGFCDKVVIVIKFGISQECGLDS